MFLCNNHWKCFGKCQYFSFENNFLKNENLYQQTSEYRSWVESAKIENETGITKPWTHLHQAPSTPTLLISVSTQLHPSTPNSFQSPALCILNVIKTKILHVIGQFPQI